MNKLKTYAAWALLILLALWVGKFVLRLILPLVLLGVLIYVLTKWRR
ncbi:MAG: hypothetical protein RMM53_01610 [Bacteroidia bacterium]|nr:hypothetical protein [Bacteroidia bacterium]MDW8332889.1 hypothetical protein [Bacteroidia bacterium]